MSSAPLRVLLVEDDRDDALIILRHLREKPDRFLVEHAVTVDAARQRLRAGGIDVVLLDLNLPDCRGPETVARMREGLTRVPIIVMTGVDDEHVALEAARAGAQDYLVKGQQRGEVLSRTLHYAVERHHAAEELRRYAEMLASSEARFRRLIDELADGIIIVDDDGDVRLVNRAALAMYGRGEEEVIGQPFGFPVVAGETTTIQILRVDAERVIAEMRVAETTWHGRRALLASLRDISAHRRAEALEHRLSAEEEVVRRLKDLDRMKNEFISTVTHELRTPMTPLRSAVEMLLDGTLGPLANAQQQQALEMMDRNIQRLARFATDVLTLARLDAGRYPLQTAPFSLRAVLQPVVELLRADGTDNGDVSLEVDAALTVEADADALAQVVTNLVRNALVHNPPGTRVTVAARVRSDDFVEVAVADDGAGIPEDAQGQLFGRFFQAGREAGPGYRGTGLGLAVCKELVEAQGGALTFESEEGAGTTFRFTLPTVRDRPAPLFGRLAQKAELITADQLEEALRRQRRDGRDALRLGEVLVGMKALSAGAVAELLAAQDVEILACLACGRRFNARRYREGPPPRCPGCDDPLTPAQKGEDVRVESDVR